MPRMKKIGVRRKIKSKNGGQKGKWDNVPIILLFGDQES